MPIGLLRDMLNSHGDDWLVDDFGRWINLIGAY